MINNGKCPKCETVITSVRIEDVDVKVGWESAWKGISYCCPHCNTIISVQIDPVALKTDTVNEIIKKLRSG